MTIKDIAKECGYAVGTVSRVLNGNPNVSAEAREKVMEAVRRHDFVPNNSARQLKSRSFRTIAVIIKGTATTILNNLLGIIQRRMEKLPYLLSVVVLDEYDNETVVANRLINEQRPSGIIFLGGNPEYSETGLKRISVPSVLITNSIDKEGFPLASSVTTDDVAGAECCTRHLIKNGHRNICVIGGDLETSSINLKRYQGFLNAMHTAKLPFDYERSFCIARHEFADAARAVKILLGKNPGMTAVFTMSDNMAIGACRQLIDMGISVPQQISITGYDGIPITNFYTPRLTTIQQDEQALANTGLDILLDRIERMDGKNNGPGAMPPARIQIPFRFIKGESVATVQPSPSAKASA